MQTSDFFRSRIDAMINLNDPLAVLATRLPWAQIEAALAPMFEHKDRSGRTNVNVDLFGPSFALVGAGRSNAGRPRLPIRLMTSLLYLKHSFNLSDEEVVQRWSENVLWQFFSGMDYYEHRLPCDATQIGRFRVVVGEAGLEQMLKATINTAVAIKAAKPEELERVIVDTTVQEKAIAHPVDSRLLEIARHKVVSAARRTGIALKQTYAKEGKTLRRQAGGYAHAKQFRRLKRVVKRQRTILGVVMREVQRKCAAPGFATDSPLALTELKKWLERAERIRTQQRHDKNKLYALHAPEVECIGKGKARKPYEFGVKNAVVVSHEHGLMLGARTFPGNPYDGHILSAVLEQARNITRDVSVVFKQVVVDLGFRGVDADNPGAQIIHRGKFNLGDSTSTCYEIVQTSWKARIGATTTFDKSWRRIVHDGLLPASAFPQVVAQTTEGTWMQSLPASNQGNLDISFRLDPNVLDGRYANNGWMQELPKPLTKLTWDNAALLSPKTAKRLAIADPEGSARGTFVDRVNVRAGGTSISIPAWVVPGHPDDTVTLHLGAGRKRSGKVGQGVGVDVQPLRSSSTVWSRAGASITLEGVRYAMGCTQDHWAMEDAAERGLVRSGSFEQFKAKPDFAQHAKEQGEQPSLYPAHPYNGNKWGMSIDLSACIGCNACITACQSENNIAVVGKDQVMRGREMQWLRIDRYYEGDSEAPAVHHQPVPCMQCENAPCEVVCPVAATTHSDEGLNDMVYNRCVGTRYCANNCPYKVRRFNFFLYSDWDTESLKLQKNPDVTVRSRGVMEKCTYCVQRVSEARINSRNEGREIRDGEIKTACQQVCPTQAIVFGDLNNAASEVSKKKASPRNYVLLHELNTRPRTSYLASVRNPNPELHVAAPDSHDAKKEAAAPHD